MAEFKEIMAMRLDGKSYGDIASALGCSNRDISRVIEVIKLMTSPAIHLRGCRKSSSTSSSLTDDGPAKRRMSNRITRPWPTSWRGIGI
ncbi:hypothetical protein [Corynebacterium pilosum]|uniref:hypothetical protein n=1 Tax=Corynebacterium pilosum TaxID=35756 RepID=UPI000AE442CE|nr:hypothetical protein [Corynebacterium pilosum]